MRVPEAIEKAFRRYYANRAAQHEHRWDKDADLRYFQRVASKYVRSWEAIAGTFLIVWKRPRVQTIHNEKNWWTCKIAGRWVDGKYIKSKNWF